MMRRSSTIRADLVIPKQRRPAPEGSRHPEVRPPSLAYDRRRTKGSRWVERRRADHTTEGWLASNPRQRIRLTSLPQTCCAGERSLQRVGRSSRGNPAPRRHMSESSSQPPPSRAGAVDCASALAAGTARPLLPERDASAPLHLKRRDHTRRPESHALSIERSYNAPPSSILKRR